MIEAAAVVVEVEPLTREELSEMSNEELLAFLPALPDELRQAAADLMQEREDEKIRKLQDLIRRLEGKRDECVVAKRPIEERWAEDRRQLEGLRRTVKGTRTERNVGEDKLPPGLNLTASRSMIWSARVTNMMVPGASGQPWTVNPTPSPEMWGENGAQIPPEIAKQAAEQSAAGMRDEIKDQFAECHVPQQVRMAAKDLVEIGTGIICGPENYRRRKRKYRKIQSGDRVVMDVQVDQTTRPAWRRVDPRYYFPEMVETIAKARYGFELIPQTTAELKELSKTEGFEPFREQFAELLEKKPDLGAWAVNLANWNNSAPYKDAVEGRYAVWKYIGYLSREESELLGCECLGAVDSEGREIDREEQMLEVWFCDGCVLKAAPYVLDGSDRLPYYVVSFFPLDDSMFGAGIPFRARDAQDSIHALWAALQHNVSVSAGSITAFTDGKVEFPNNSVDIRGPTVVRIIDPDVRDIREVFSSFVIPNNAEQILAILQFRIQSFDEEINLPLIAQGQPSESVPTSSGLAMLMNAANVAQKDIAQSCEDGWLVPMLESAYAWNMLHNPREDIKGDFDCVATLTSDNVFKDLKAQRLMMVHGMRREDQEMQLRVNEETLYSQLSQAMEVGELFLSPQEVEAKKQQMQQNQQPDPLVLKAQLDQQRLQMEAESKARDDEFRRMDREFDHQEFLMDQETKRIDAETRRMVAEVGFETEVMRLQQEAQDAAGERETKAVIAASRERIESAKIGVQARVKADNKNI